MIGARVYDTRTGRVGRIIEVDVDDPMVYVAWDHGWAETIRMEKMSGGRYAMVEQ